MAERRREEELQAISRGVFERVRRIFTCATARDKRAEAKQFPSVARERPPFQVDPAALYV